MVSVALILVFISIFLFLIIIVIGDHIIDGPCDLEGYLDDLHGDTDRG